MKDKPSFEQEARARAIINKASDAFIELSLNGIIIDCNEKAESVFGWAHNEAISKNIFDTIIPNRHKKLCLEQLKQYGITGSSPALNTKLELTAINKNEQEFPVELEIFPIRTNGSVTLGTFIRNVSDRKNVELALRETEEIFRLLVSGVKDYAIFMLSPEGKIVTWNEGARRIKGYKAEEIIGQHFSCFYSEDEKAANKPAYELEIATRKGTYEETGLRLRKDGSPFWANVLITALFDEEGHLKGFTKVTRDITEQKEATDELRMQAEMLESTFDAILLRDLNGTIRYWNAGAERMYGFNHQEAIGKISHHLLNSKFPKPLAQIEQELIREQHWDGELLHYSRDGRRMIVFSRQSLKLDTKGKPVGVLEINSDITATKQAEQRKLALAELKRINVDLEQFAYVASHDLQEPLRGVAGGLQILAKKYKGRLDDEADELIDMAVEGATRMRTLIADLLSLSQINSTKATFALTPLSEVLEHAQANLALTIQETNTNITSDSLPTLVVEKARIIQLFQNLVSNAIKFRSDKLCQIHLSATNQDGVWLFSVKDNGVGFEQKFADRIFEPFKRLHGRDQYPGNGIGLALCKRIVERHGGQIWVESEPNKGTTFYFTIPDVRSSG